ncbi:hypothetical protein PENTCL1PPCAC_30008, partial [Pristionchus entomophagus]
EQGMDCFVPKEEDVDEELQMIPETAAESVPHLPPAPQLPGTSEDMIKEEEKDPLLTLGESVMRPRGTLLFTHARDLPNLSNNFDECDICHVALAGCITDSRLDDVKNRPSTSILTCGHVVCPTCLDRADLRLDRGVVPRPQFRCQICNELVAKIVLPNRENVNLASCQAPYCSGESFAVPRTRCVTCQRNICDECLVNHAQRYPNDDHIMDSRPRIIPSLRPFTMCIRHQHHISARCTCGEMVCGNCQHNAKTVSGAARAPIVHRKIPLEKTDVISEDATLNVPETLQKFVKMRQST